MAASIEARTRSPQKQKTGITRAQKQALMDNLQLEITERARKLRAQYALQSQQLRSRLEMRVNRIPSALRKKTMGDLTDENARREAPKPPPALVALADGEKQKRSLKRTSDHAFAAQSEDKDNVTSGDAMHELANPKKRTKTTQRSAEIVSTEATTAYKNPRSKITAPNVLSPRSHNSRTLPRSPLKTMLPTSYSPVKASQGRAMSRATNRQPSRTMRATSAAKKAGALETEGRDSESSTTSAGTTIVKKSGTTAKRATAASKPPAKTVTKKATTATKKENVAPAPAAGGRTLRKRG